MNRTSHMILLAAAMLSAAACTADAAKRQEEPITVRETTIQGKPEAPVAIAAGFAGTSARVTARFSQAGSEVELRVRGIDGLQVAGRQVLAAGSRVAVGEELAFDVPFTAGPGQSLLVVEVKGKFDAGERGTVRAFPIGTPSAEQQKQRSTAPAAIGGEPVHLMQLEEKPAK